MEQFEEDKLREIFTLHSFSDKNERPNWKVFFSTIFYVQSCGDQESLQFSGSIASSRNQRFKNKLHGFKVNSRRSGLIGKSQYNVQFCGDHAEIEIFRIHSLQPKITFFGNFEFAPLFRQERVALSENLIFHHILYYFRFVRSTLGKESYSYSFSSAVIPFYTVHETRPNN